MTTKTYIQIDMLLHVGESNSGTSTGCTPILIHSVYHGRYWLTLDISGNLRSTTEFTNSRWNLCFCTAQRMFRQEERLQSKSQYVNWTKKNTFKRRGFKPLSRNLIPRSHASVKIQSQILYLSVAFLMSVILENYQRFPLTNWLLFGFQIGFQSKLNTNAYDAAAANPGLVGTNIEPGRMGSLEAFGETQRYCGLKNQIYCVRRWSDTFLMCSCAEA